MAYSPENKDYLVSDKDFSPQQARERIRRFGKKYLGRPYKYGAKDYDAPQEFDCSSLMQYLYRRVGIDIPRITIKQAEIGREVEPKLSNLKIGDMIFIKGVVGRYNRKFPDGIGHVAMYFGEGKVIQACNQNLVTGEYEKKVMLEDADQFLDLKGFRIVKRVLRGEDEERTKSLFEE